jgi:hypothetical protein
MVYYTNDTVSLRRKESCAGSVDGIGQAYIL